MSNVITRETVTVEPRISLARRIRSTVAVKLAAIFAVFGLLTVVGATQASAAGPTDPLDGAGTDLADSLLTNFTTYVIPAVVGILVAVLAFKLIVKMATRFLNRA